MMLTKREKLILFIGIVFGKQYSLDDAWHMTLAYAKYIGCNLEETEEFKEEINYMLNHNTFETVTREAMKGVDMKK